MLVYWFTRYCQKYLRFLNIREIIKQIVLRTCYARSNNYAKKNCICYLNGIGEMHLWGYDRISRTQSLLGTVLDQGDCWCFLVLVEKIRTQEDMFRVGKIVFFFVSTKSWLQERSDNNYIFLRKKKKKRSRVSILVY